MMISDNRTGNSDASGPLVGIRVIDLTSYVLGPVATQILGDLGADVIKVESPQGDPCRQIGPQRYPDMAAVFIGVNRNKRSIVLDLKRSIARETLLRMVETADVFVHSMRPQAAQRLGIDYAAIAARNPSIVYAFAPGYRADGPLRDRPAYDDVIQGESGLVSMNYLVSGETRYMPTAICDKTCGYVLASSIGMALFYRERTGQGQEVQVPMLETMLSFNLHEHLWTGAFDAPMGELGYVRMLTPDRRPYATKDGYICLMATSDEQWHKLFIALGRPELEQDERFAKLAQRSLHFPELYAVVVEEMKERTTAEWQKRLDIADVPSGPVRMLADLPNDPYLKETGFFRHYAHPSAGPLVTTSNPVQFSRSGCSLRLPPPCLGEHTHAILEELAYSESEIAEITAT